MILDTFTKAALRTLVSTLTGLALAAALPQAGIAASSDANIWKIDPAKSKFSTGYATLTLQRAAGVNPTAGSFIVISKGNIYRVTGPVPSGVSTGDKQIDAANPKTGSPVLIGTNARSPDVCGLMCQSGLADGRMTTMTVIFKAVRANEQQINDMLAADGKNK